MFGEYQKKVEMEIVGSGANRDQLRAKAWELFQVEEFKIQMWDRGFEEWVDIDEGDLVENNSKVLISKPAMPRTELDASTPSSNSSMNEDKADTMCSLKTVGASAEPVTAVSQREPPCMPALQPRSTVSSPTWHLSYKLPTIPSTIDAKLQSGQPLKEAERSAILDAIYNSVKIHTYYPKTGQYDTITQLILDKYPKLLSQQSMSYANVKSLWKYRLQYKFANCRKREDNNIPSVKARKRHVQPAALTQPSGKRPAPQWGMTNYLPARQQSEDDASVKIHTGWLQQEIAKKKPNYMRVREAMGATFSDRRKLIVNECASVADIKRMYPWLFDEDELLQEFCRIEGKSSMTALLDDGLQKYTDAIVTLAKALKKRPKLLDAVLAQVPLQKQDAERKELRRRASIMTIPTLLQEKLTDMLLFEDLDFTTASPVYIEVKVLEDDECRYTLMVDGIAVASSVVFSTAFSLFLSTFYCFNMAYPSCLRKTLNFYQKVLLNIQDNLPIDKSVVKILDKINYTMSKSH